jgi:hypothetical protein
VSAVRHTLVIYTLGDFLGMLMLLPALLWQRRPKSGQDAATFQRHGIWTLATVGVLFVAIAFATDMLLKQLLIARMEITVTG